MEFLKRYEKYNLKREAELLFSNINLYKGVYKKNTLIDYKNGYNTGILHALIAREPEKKTKLKHKKFNIKSKDCWRDGFNAGYVATYQELDFWYKLKNNH